MTNPLTIARVGRRPLQTLLVSGLIAAGMPAAAPARSDGENSPGYSIRSAVIRIDRTHGLVRVYFRLNRALPFGPDADDSTSSSYVHARVRVANTSPLVARGVMRIGDRARHCYSDELEYRTLPRVLRRAKLRSLVSLSVSIDGQPRTVRKEALVIGNRDSARARLRCGRREAE